MIFIGIDNGLSGGIVAIDERQNILLKTPMPLIITDKKYYDVQKIIDIINQFKEVDTINVIVEKSFIQIMDGKKSCFNMGFCYGLIQGLLTAMNVPFEIVAPQVWMKEIFQGAYAKSEKVSVLYCVRKYPNTNWVIGVRAKTIHDGMTDACCIALYGHKKFYGTLHALLNEENKDKILGGEQK
jgi:hypothetical protein